MKIQHGVDNMLWKYDLKKTGLIHSVLYLLSTVCFCVSCVSISIFTASGVISGSINAILYKSAWTYPSLVNELLHIIFVMEVLYYQKMCSMKDSNEGTITVLFQDFYAVNRLCWWNCSSVRLLRSNYEFPWFSIPEGRTHSTMWSKLKEKYMKL